MPIPDRFDISRSKEMVNGVIFGVEYVISFTKTKMLEKLVFFFWPFWGSDGPPIVGNGRYANSR